MDELKEEFESAGDSTKKLNKLLDRIASIKFFDPTVMRKSGGAWKTASDGDLVA